MKKIFLLIMSTSVLAACGGGGSGSANPESIITSSYTEQEIIDDLGLPTHPEETHPDYNRYNGVDDNKNKIRDDVERYIGFKHYPDKQKIAYLNGLAKASFEMQEAYENKDGNSYSAGMQSMYRSMSCYKSFYDRFEVRATLLQLKNTDERKDAALERSKMMAGSGLMSFTRPSDKGKYKEMCEGLFPVKND